MLRHRPFRFVNRSNSRNIRSSVLVYSQGPFTFGSTSFVRGNAEHSDPSGRVDKEGAGGISINFSTVSMSVRGIQINSKLFTVFPFPIY